MKDFAGAVGSGLNAYLSMEQNKRADENHLENIKYRNLAHKRQVEMDNDRRALQKRQQASESLQHYVGMWDGQNPEIAGKIAQTLMDLDVDLGVFDPEYSKQFQQTAQDFMQGKIKAGDPAMQMLGKTVFNKHLNERTKQFPNSKFEFHDIVPVEGDGEHFYIRAKMTGEDGQTKIVPITLNGTGDKDDPVRKYSVADAVKRVQGISGLVQNMPEDLMAALQRYRNNSRPDTAKHQAVIDNGGSPEQANFAAYGITNYADPEITEDGYAGQRNLVNNQFSLWGHVNGKGKAGNGANANAGSGIDDVWEKKMVDQMKFAMGASQDENGNIVFAGDHAFKKEDQQLAVDAAGLIYPWVQGLNLPQQPSFTQMATIFSEMSQGLPLKHKDIVGRLAQRYGNPEYGLMPFDELPPQLKNEYGQMRQESLRVIQSRLANFKYAGKLPEMDYGQGEQQQASPPPQQQQSQSAQQQAAPPPSGVAPTPQPQPTSDYSTLWN